MSTLSPTAHNILHTLAQGGTLHQQRTGKYLLLRPDLRRDTAPADVVKWLLDVGYLEPGEPPFLVLTEAGRAVL